MITGAKALLFFNFKERTDLPWLVNKTICHERMEVSFLEEEDCAYQVKDPNNGDFYGTKVGNSILQFTPTGLAESRGREKHRPGLILSRVFKLKKTDSGMMIMMPEKPSTLFLKPKE